MTQVRLKEVDPVNAASFARQAQLAERRFEYLIQRRDAHLDKARFGALAINAASLVALGSILTGSGEAAAWLGFNPPRSSASACFFIFGAMAAVVAIALESVRTRGEPADAYARQSDLNILAALYEGVNSEDNVIAIRETMARYHDLPLVDFQYSKSSIWAENLAGAAWLGGAAVPFLHLLPLIWQ